MKTRQFRLGSLLLGAVLVIAGSAATVQWLRSRKAGALEKQSASAGAPIALAREAAQRNHIVTEKVKKTRLAADLQIVGSVSYDQNHYAVVGPLVPGRVSSLRVGVGDLVRPGQTLAEVESAEVGQAQATFLSAIARAGAAEANVHRERDLASQRISSARDREVAEAQATSESAEVKAAVERLRALGLSGADIESLRRGHGAGGRLLLRAPIRGTVVSRSITLGQAVERATDAFRIIDLTHLWVLLDLYERDLGRVHAGQAAELRTEAHPGETFRARVAYVTPLIDEKTRTANVRIEFDNAAGKLRPGQFVTARLVGDSKHVSAETLAVARSAVQTVDGKSAVFVSGPSGFERRLVEIGLSSGDWVEVRSGLSEGEEVATDGAFLLKSELLR